MFFQFQFLFYLAMFAFCLLLCFVLLSAVRALLSYAYF